MIHCPSQMPRSIVERRVKRQLAAMIFGIIGCQFPCLWSPCLVLACSPIFHVVFDAQKHTPAEPLYLVLRGSPEFVLVRTSLLCHLGCNVFFMRVVGISPPSRIWWRRCPFVSASRRCRLQRFIPQPPLLSPPSPSSFYRDTRPRNVSPFTCLFGTREHSSARCRLTRHLPYALDRVVSIYVLYLQVRSPEDGGSGSRVTTFWWLIHMS